MVTCALRTRCPPRQGPAMLVCLSIHKYRSGRIGEEDMAAHDTSTNVLSLCTFPTFFGPFSDTFKNIYLLMLRFGGLQCPPSFHIFCTCARMQLGWHPKVLLSIFKHATEVLVLVGSPPMVPSPSHNYRYFRGSPYHPVSRRSMMVCPERGHSFARAHIQVEPSHVNTWHS